MSRNQVFAAGATVAVLFGLALGFRQAGSPHLQRLANADQARVEDLNAISGAISSHYAMYLALPQSLDEVHRNTALRVRDPETRMAYEYRPLDERRFELCAVFSTDNRSEPSRSPAARVHGAGRQCFTYPE